MGEMAPRAQRPQTARAPQRGAETTRRLGTAVTHGSDSRSPRVVLGMTLHNNARHLPDAAASLLAQSCRDFALVMLDDASSDETPRIVETLAATDRRIKFFRHQQRAGMIPT